MIFSFIIASLLLTRAANAQSFVKTGGDCHEGHSGADCPRVWSITGGPGWWVGHCPDHPVEMICSKSCTDNANPKVCSLMMVLHGTHSNPGTMKYFTIGSATDPTHETFLEDEAHGGPFCISFHKAIDNAWDEYNKCGGDDEGRY